MSGEIISTDSTCYSSAREKDRQLYFEARRTNSEITGYSNFIVVHRYIKLNSREVKEKYITINGVNKEILRQWEEDFESGNTKPRAKSKKSSY